MRGGNEARLAGEVVLVEGQDVADVGVELYEEVAEARDVKVGVVDGLGQRGHGEM